MGPCLYCKKMIFLDWVAERGYHRECHERYLAQRQAAQLAESKIERDLREHEKRRLRKARKRQEYKEER